MSQKPEAPLDIPERYEDVTAEWLTQALRAGGVLSNQVVSTFKIEPFGAGKGRLSSQARIVVEYDGHSDGLPNSMFAKFVSRIPGNRERADQRNLFRTEIALYENFGDAIPLNMPQMYFGGAEEGSDVAVLLLEEINAVSKEGLPAAQVFAITPFEASLALRDLAKMHARWWDDQTLDGHEWLLPVDSDRRRNEFQLYDEAWANMRDVLEPVLNPAEVRICNGMSSYLPTLMSELKKMPTTLCHGDFHPGNLLWDRTGEPETVWAVDWQVSATGPAVLDVAYFLGMGVARADLPLVRKEILPEYHNALLEGGVNDYEYQRFLSDYRYGLLNTLEYVIGALSAIDLAREDSVEFARNVVSNIAACAVDAGCGDLFS